MLSAAGVYQRLLIYFYNELCEVDLSCVSLKPNFVAAVNSAITLVMDTL